MQWLRVTHQSGYKHQAKAGATNKSSSSCGLHQSLHNICHLECWANPIYRDPSRSLPSRLPGKTDTAPLRWARSFLHLSTSAGTSKTGPETINDHCSAPANLSTTNNRIPLAKHINCVTHPHTHTHVTHTPWECTSVLRNAEAGPLRVGQVCFPLP